MHSQPKESLLMCSLSVIPPVVDAAIYSLDTTAVVCYFYFI